VLVANQIRLIDPLSRRAAGPPILYKRFHTLIVLSCASWSGSSISRSTTGALRGLGAAVDEFSCGASAASELAFTAS